HRRTPPGTAGSCRAAESRDTGWFGRGRPDRDFRHRCVSRRPACLFEPLRNHRASEDDMLQMTHLFKTYRTEVVETCALRDFSLHVREGEFVAVTGPSGSGKTTFLTIAGLLEEFSSGEYLLDGVDVLGLNDRQRSRLRNEKIGFIFQAFNLLP